MDIAGIPYVSVQFGRDGQFIDEAEVGQARSMITDAQATDLLVLAHGWNNNKASATERYTRFLTQAGDLLKGELKERFAGRRLVAIGVMWPSMRYTERELIPGGAASTDLEKQIRAELEAARTLFAGQPDHPVLKVIGAIEADLAAVPDKQSLRRELTEAVQEQLRHLPAAMDSSSGEVDPNRLQHARVEKRLNTNLDAVTTADDKGHAAGGFLTGPFQVIRNLLNLSTYYEMKARAGLVGERGLRTLIRTLRQDHAQLRVHLIGHSFGGRLVSAAARGPDGDERLVIDSLHLLQAAFSHYGFGEATGEEPEGYFRPVVTGRHVRGPMLITHTKNDLAVGKAYVIASALSGQNAAGFGDFGDRNDPYGAIGSNGALNAGAVPLRLTETMPGDFEEGKIYNLHADLIPNHGDVERPAVVRAVLLGAST